MLAQFYPPVPGGAEIHVRNLAHGLAHRGHEVEVATLRQDGATEDADDGPVRVHRLGGVHRVLGGLYSPGLPRAAAPFPDPIVGRALAGIVRRLQPQVVHGHNWLLHSFLPLAPFTDAGVVASLHNYGLVCAKQTLMRNGSNCTGPGFEKCLRCAGRHYGLARGIATCAGLWGWRPAELRTVRRFLPVATAVAERNGLPGSGLPYSVIPNFVPDDVAVPGEDVAAHAAQLPHGPFMLFVGALGRVKGLGVLFDAYRMLRNPPPLVVIGFRGGETEEVLASAPPGVSVHLDWPHAAVMEAWRRCTVGVCPSLWHEPCPTVVIEAMAAGAPLVASQVGGIPELLDDGTAGVLVPPGEAPRLAAELERLLGDESLRRGLSAAALRRATAYTASAVIPRVEAVYDEVVAGAATHPVGARS